MPVPAAKFGPSNTFDNRGLLTVVDQVAVGDPSVSKVATASAGAATLNTPSGVVTSESLVTAASGVYTLTLTNSCVAATDIVLVTVGNGTNSTGTPGVATVTPAAGSVVIAISNDSTGAAFNGTLKIGFVIVKV